LMVEIRLPLETREAGEKHEESLPVHTA